MSGEIGPRQRAILGAALFSNTIREIRIRASRVPGPYIFGTLSSLSRRGLVRLQGDEVELTDAGRSIALEEWRA